MSKGRALASSVVASVPLVVFIALRPLPQLRQLPQLLLRLLGRLRWVRCVRCFEWKPRFSVRVRVRLIELVTRFWAGLQQFAENWREVETKH